MKPTSLHNWALIPLVLSTLDGNNCKHISKMYTRCDIVSDCIAIRRCDVVRILSQMLRHLPCHFSFLSSPCLFFCSSSFLLSANLGNSFLFSYLPFSVGPFQSCLFSCQFSPNAVSSPLVLVLFPHTFLSVSPRSRYALYPSWIVLVILSSLLFSPFPFC